MKCICVSVTSSFSTSYAIIEWHDIILNLETKPRTDQFPIAPYKYLYIAKHTVALMYHHYLRAYITRHVGN